MKKPSTATEEKTGSSRKTGGQSGASAQSMSGNGAAAQSAEEVLKADHRKVEQLFKKYEGLTDESEKASCVQEICKELTMHAMLEEEIFYTACREKGVKSDMLDEAQVEHDGAKVLIQELMSEEPDAEFYDAKVSVLSEYIKHHVGEEEKGSEGIFALANKAGVDMDALGKELQARKVELMQEFESEGLALPEFHSLQAIDAQSNRQEYEMPRYESEGRGSYRSSGGGRSSGRERDEYGRFMSDDDDDRRGSRSSRGGGGRSRYEDDDDNGRGHGRGGWFGDSEGHSEAARSGRSGGSRSGGRYYDEDDDEGRGHDRGGWFGDSEGHSEAARRGRGGSSRSSGRYYDDDDDDGRGPGRGGWFGDPEGHSEASRRGWDSRDDDRGGGGRSSRSGGGRSRYEDDNDEGRGHGRGGWFGDSEGHSEAARRGRSGGSSRSSGGGSRYEDDDDGRGHGRGGWFGDSRGHAEAARRGWRNRD